MALERVKTFNIRIILVKVDKNFIIVITCGGVRKAHFDTDCLCTHTVQSVDGGRRQREKSVFRKSKVEDGGQLSAALVAARNSLARTRLALMKWETK